MATKPSEPKWEPTGDGWDRIHNEAPPPIELSEVGDWVRVDIDATTKARGGKRKKAVRVLLGTRLDTGERVSIWPSAGLAKLVKMAKPGHRVAIQYTGQTRTRKGNMMRTYALAIQPLPPVE